MKRINKVLLLLLLMPLCISFSACKKKNSTENSNQNQIEQPTTPDDGDDEPGYESTKETYSVSFDYNLPEEYDFLLADKDFEVTYKEVGTSTSLATVPDIKLKEFFLGWVEEGSDTVLTDSVTTDKSKNFKLKGKWDEVALNKYYYSDGLNIDVIDGKASISSYTGTDDKIFIPEVYREQEQNYFVREIQASVFESKQFDKLIVHASDLVIGDSAFKNSNISDFDFSRVRKIGKNAFENTRFVALNLDDDISSIDVAAFKNCELLETVDFNNNNIEISKEMFSGCVKLETIGNTKFIKLIDIKAFENCVSLINTDFIGSSVSVIEEYAFKNCTGLISVTLPESLNGVYENAFEGCTAISELILGRTFENPNLDNDSLIKHIGNIGTNITKITFVGDSTSKLSEYYFDGLTNLHTFIMCDSITEVEPYAFRECVNLKNIRLSENLDVDKLTINAFFGTKFKNEMTEPWIYKHQVIFVPKTIDEEFEFLAADAVTAIRDGAFAFNKTLKKITIPASVSYIGDGAFEYCDSLEEVVFEENSNITTLNNNLFANCYKLKDVDLTKLTALTKIEDNAFVGVQVSNMVIPSTVTEIGRSVFFTAAISNYAISGTSENYETVDGVLYHIVDGKRVLFSYPTLKEGELFFCPSDVTSVAAYAFSNVYHLKFIYFENAMAWEEIDYETKSFEGSASISLFAEKSTFNTDEVSRVYRFVSLNVTYDAEKGTVTLENGFATAEKYLYMTVVNQTTHKIDIVYFEVVTTDSGNEKTYSIKNNSVKVLKTERDA